MFQKALEENADKIEDEKGSLFSVSIYKRIITYFAGPAFNFIFAILVFSLIWIVGFTYETFSNKIIMANDYPILLNPSAENDSFDSDLKTGDIILEINNTKVSNFDQILDYVGKSADKSLSIKIERDNKLYNFNITPILNKDMGIGEIGILPWIDLIIESTIPESGASLAELKKGDIITMVDNINVYNKYDIDQFLSKRPSSVELTIIRDNKTIKKRINVSFNENNIPFLGIRFKSMIFNSEKVSFFLAIKKGTLQAIDTIDNVIKSFSTLFKGINLRKVVSGPVRIIYMTGQYASYGFKSGIKNGIIYLFKIVSLLSTALFFMNLLPIPALDGGQIIISAVEAFRKKPISPKFLYRYQIVGFFIILIILFFSTFNDIFYFLGFLR